MENLTQNLSEKIKLHGKAIFILILLQLLIDMLYVWLYPTVNPTRASLIGATAFIVLLIPWLEKQVGLGKLAFLPIFVNALLGALSVQAGWVASKSAASGVLHIGILIITYFVLVKVRK